MQFFKRFSFSLAVFLALLCAGVVSAAWSGPSAAPPDNGNITAPINTGSSNQTKVGDLYITGVLQANGGLGATSVTVGATVNGGAITAPKFCIGSDCRNSWSAVSGGSQWTTSGSNIYYNVAGGKVGIETTAAQITQPLTVGGSVLLTTGQLLGSVADTAALPSYSWGSDPNSGMFNALNDTIGFATVGVERMRISNTGNVGIGMVPNASYKLDVNGIVRATQFIYNSDARLKHSVQTLGDSLSKVLSLRGVSFVWNSGTVKAGQEDIGFIAQEVEKIAPELVQTDTNGYKAVDYARAAPLLVNAIHEQQAQLDAQQKQIDALTARLDALSGQTPAH